MSVILRRDYVKQMRAEDAFLFRQKFIKDNSLTHQAGLSYTTSSGEGNQTEISFSYCHGEIQVSLTKKGMNMRDLGGTNDLEKSLQEKGFQIKILTEHDID